MLRLKPHAIKPQFILRRGAYWTDLASGQVSAKYFCWITLRMPSRMTRPLLLFVHITQIMLGLSCTLRDHAHRSYVPVGDKVTGISIYLRVKTSPPLPVSSRFSFRSASCREKDAAGCRLAPIATINRCSFSRERIVERATMSLATSPGRYGQGRGSG